MLIFELIFFIIKKSIHFIYSLIIPNDVTENKNRYTTTHDAGYSYTISAVKLAKEKQILERGRLRGQAEDKENRRKQREKDNPGVLVDPKMPPQMESNG